jgi:uncharacterized protein with von Willebrand factor type A (vWA) domain
VGGTTQLAAGAQVAPSVNFLGATAKARHVVYVIDRSGSMICPFFYLRHRVAVSVAELSEAQHFEVILLGESQPVELPEDGLVRATGDNRAATIEFLTRYEASGDTDPEPALKRAFEVLAKIHDKEGKLIIFLTDWDFGEDNANVLALIKKLNPSQEVQINTFLYSAAEDKADRQVLEKVARDSGGTYTFFDTNNAE